MRALRNYKVLGTTTQSHGKRAVGGIGGTSRVTALEMLVERYEVELSAEIK